MLVWGEWQLWCVTELRDNSIQMKKDLEHYLYQIRINAEVHVEEMVGIGRSEIEKKLIATYCMYYVFVRCLHSVK